MSAELQCYACSLLKKHSLADTGQFALISLITVAHLRGYLLVIIHLCSPETCFRILLAVIPKQSKPPVDNCIDNLCNSPLIATQTDHGEYLVTIGPRLLLNKCMTKLLYALICNLPVINSNA